MNGYSVTRTGDEKFLIGEDGDPTQQQIEVIDGKVCIGGTGGISLSPTLAYAIGRYLTTFGMTEMLECHAVLWTAPDNSRVTVKCDGNQFLAEINGGIEGETYLSVGYSCPNYASISPDMLPAIADACNRAWAEIEEVELEDMLRGLLSLAKAANEAYNRCL